MLKVNTLDFWLGAIAAGLVSLVAAWITQKYLNPAGQRAATFMAGVLAYLLYEWFNIQQDVILLESKLEEERKSLF